MCVKYRTHLGVSGDGREIVCEISHTMRRSKPPQRTHRLFERACHPQFTYPLAHIMSMMYYLSAYLRFSIASKYGARSCLLAKRYMST